jgi:D-sedoheptulose 7-phosphate isomerase
MVARFKMERPGLPAQALTDPCTITCWANDYDFDTVFSRQVDAHGKKGDVLVAISTSGNSKNIVNAIKKAKEKKMEVIGLSGKGGGMMNGLCDLNIVVPSENTARIQECHITIIHAICELVEKEMFGNGK